MASSVDALTARVCDITPEQVEDTAMVVTSEMGHVRGLKEIDKLTKQKWGSFSPLASESIMNTST